MKVEKWVCGTCKAYRTSPFCQLCGTKAEYPDDEPQKEWRLQVDLLRLAVHCDVQHRSKFNSIRTIKLKIAEDHAVDASYRAMVDSGQLSEEEYESMQRDYYSRYSDRSVAELESHMRRWKRFAEAAEYALDLLPEKFTDVDRKRLAVDWKP